MNDTRLYATKEKYGTEHNVIELCDEHIKWLKDTHQIREIQPDKPRKLKCRYCQYEQGMKNKP